MKKILVLLIAALTFSVSTTFAQEEELGDAWETEFSGAVVHKLNGNAGSEGEQAVDEGLAEPGSAPVGALAIPFAAMLALYGVSAMRKTKKS